MLVTLSELKTLITEAIHNDTLSVLKANDELSVFGERFLIVKVYGKPKLFTRHALDFGDDVEIWSEDEFSKTQFTQLRDNKLQITKVAYYNSDTKSRFSPKTHTRTTKMIAENLGSFRYAERYIRVNKNMMSAWGGLPVRKKDLIDLRIVAFIDGNNDMFDEWLAQEDTNSHMDQSRYVNLADVKYTSGVSVEPMADMGDFKKPDIIAYVVSLNGPLTRSQILKQVATIQGLPYIPTSNTSYFRNLQAIGLQRTRIEGKKETYVITPDGERMAKKVIDAIGEQPAIDVREDL